MFLLFQFVITGCQPTSSASSGSVKASPQSTNTHPAATAPIPTNTAVPPRVHLRQAIAYCTDRSALIRSVYPWITDTRPFEANSFLPSSHWALMDGNMDVSQYPYSPKTGMTLLDTMGWKLANGATIRTNPNGETLTLILTTTDVKFRQTWTTVWEEQMKTCGIRIVRKSVTAEWLFGAESGLSHRDFELAAFASSSFDELRLVKTFACDQIPNADNGWQGQNFSAWCSPAVQDAVDRLSGMLDLTEQKAAYQTVQREFNLDLPVLPLFYRADVFAVNPVLENFVPPDDGIHTWNAARWQVPGRETIIIGSDGEPASLDETAYIAEVIRTLISGRDVVQIDGVFQPVLLRQVPSFDNGQVIENTAMAKEGDSVVDANGNPVKLAPGVMIRNVQGEVVQYSGGEVAMRQLVVDFDFQPGLTWSDGVPVSQADYELGYRTYCASTNTNASSACKVISQVLFLSDTHYRVHWMPGYDGSSAGAYFLPPIRRAPAHQILSDGRKLADIPLGEWPFLDEIRRAPLGVGPYVLKEWINGKSMKLEANPYYFDGPVTTLRITVRFLEHNQALAALVNGDIDILDAETIGPSDIDDFQLAKAQDEGKIRLVLSPSSVWEQITFQLGD